MEYLRAWPPQLSIRLHTDLCVVSTSGSAVTKCGRKWNIIGPVVRSISRCSGQFAKESVPSPVWWNVVLIHHPLICRELKTSSYLLSHSSLCLALWDLRPRARGHLRGMWSCWNLRFRSPGWQSRGHLPQASTALFSLEGSLWFAVPRGRAYVQVHATDILSLKLSWSSKISLLFLLTCQFFICLEKVVALSSFPAKVYYLRAVELLSCLKSRKVSFFFFFLYQIDCSICSQVS